ncbi:hybrid sensor histidine kinase/response regulator [Longimicrobium sp.]|uniref:hybrid sensor histidine kinase/response regulator n=1 Tax=Longimicrobium sp. TaxID=2029185 RepID=UPI002E31E2B0|nr:PAS domain-containing protein [Longimicrobium sp.]HEX6039752.1 PAS domain-containing protein [Longimicrobium sp.]
MTTERSSSGRYTELRSALAHVPARTALGYLAVGVLWIVLSDHAISLVTDNPADAAWIQTAKGWGFVVVTAVALYGMLVHNLREVLASQAGRQEQAALLQAVIAATTDAVFVKDLDGRYVLVNDAGAAMLGVTRQALTGRTDADVFAPADAERVRRNDQQVLESGQPVTFSETLEMDGRTRIMLATKGVVRDREGRVTGIMGISRDVTEQRRTEERSRQSQKMEAIGRLAGGVEHDFNNMLVVIGGNADLLLMDLPDDHPSRSIAQEIKNAARRAADLTRRLLATSRQQPLQPRAVPLPELVEGILPMLDRLLGDDVTLVAQLPPGDATVRADASQVEQVILNLAVNARDAMPGGGTLTLAVRPDATPPGGDGSYVLLEVTDTGVGMDDATRARIFEPFFTTKEPGGGTGLGLATVYAAVEQSGGIVEVESAPGRGTRFRVFFPRAQPDAPSADAAAPAAAPLPEGAPSTETVLVVENDDAVLRLAAAVLRRAGYRVLEAPDGARAVERVGEERGRVGLVLTDLMMPGLSGRDLARLLAATHPELPVIFMTGFDHAAPDEPGLPPGRLLQKPFTPEVLVDAVREALRGPRPG